MRRPANISSSRSSTSCASSSSTTSSVISAALSRPSLLNDIRQDLGLQTKQPTPWKVSDTSLRPVPPFYPPLDPRCTTIITDSSPSVVACRIAECLKKRSISVEYDEEMITATCMTVDRVHFQICLYRGNRQLPPSDPTNLQQYPDLSHAIIVEVMRTRGPAHSFHSHNRAILNASMGHATGQDERTPVRTSPMEYPRFKRLPRDEKDKNERPTKRLARTLETPRALEHALSLLQKDRVGAQRLGMESLVHLTDVTSCGKDIAIHASMTVIGAPIMMGDDIQNDTETAEVIHDFCMRLIRDRVLPGEDEDDCLNATYASSVDVTGIDDTRSVKSTAPLVVDDTYHGGLLRSLALRVMANALTVLSENQGVLLTNLLVNGSPLAERDFVQALAEDLLGASRLPAVVAGTRLASVHEATLATRCITILTKHSATIRRMLANPKSDTHPTLDLLQKNCNEVAHQILVEETKQAYSVLSQEFRSC